MHTDLTTLFSRLWQSYKEVTPSAERIHQILATQERQAIVNDHIALRTFNLAPVGLEALARHFTSLGYHQGGEYHFEAKKLYARHYEHPNQNVPKVFISELLVDQCSPALQATVTRLVSQIESNAVSGDDFLYSGRHWALDYATYRTLLEESEYAAWTAAWGYRANHFTVSINHLEQIQSVPQMNQLLKNHGFRINTAGGEVKGSPEDLLEQSSTMADRIDLAFSDQVAAVPSCFYEFARRYPGADGQLYPGFVAASADKIFESTHAGEPQ
ncbi:MAG: protein of unknown function containing DUF1338 domain [Marinobacter excellens HL-55]|uniref:2-oxoadipate dioxygenase/decarboxylase n=1 Tax=Marinobacter excellens HL-55 TaxID=1305731 RepID=A0A0P8B7C4_9GAMM|nr:MAG: protein of unknown function containing DUF1338 domain [Marinobacter excellens HL-55]